MNTNEMNRKSRTIVGAAAALCMAAGLAAAQQVRAPEADEDDCKTACSSERVAECEMAGDADADGEHVVIKGIAFVDGQPEVKTESRMVIIQKENDDEYKVEIKDDKVKAWVNGDRVPRKQLKVTDKQIRILDEDGETIAEFGRGMDMVFSGNVGLGGNAIRLFAQPGKGDNEDTIVWEHGEHGDWEDLGGNRFMFLGDGDGEMVFPGDGKEGMKMFRVDSDPPPVMVGINMGSLDSDDDDLYDLLDEHDLDDDEVIQIVNVIDGLPADEAGLREGDVIVRLDGEWGATPEKLRDMLMEKEPGDELEIAVVRNGRFREFEVELGAYNAEKLRSFTITMDNIEHGGDFPFGNLQWHSDGESPSEMIEQLTRKLAAQPGMDTEEIRVQIEALAKKLKSPDQFSGRIHLDRLPRMRGMAPGENGQQRFFVDRAPRDTVVTRGQADRLEKIEKRLERLEDRIERLIDALERSRD